MSEFTKGKWTAEAVYGDHWVVFDFDDERTIADCFGSEDNARLIATAPDMYAFIRTIAEDINDCKVDLVRSMRCAVAEELIARIDGKEENTAHEETD